MEKCGKKQVSPCKLTHFQPARGCRKRDTGGVMCTVRNKATGSGGEKLPQLAAHPRWCVWPRARAGSRIESQAAYLGGSSSQLLPALQGSRAWRSTCPTPQIRAWGEGGRPIVTSAFSILLPSPWEPHTSFAIMVRHPLLTWQQREGGTTLARSPEAAASSLHLLLLPMGCAWLCSSHVTRVCVGGHHLRPSPSKNKSQHLWHREYSHSLSLDVRHGGHI